MSIKIGAACALLSLVPLTSQAMDLGTYKGVDLDLTLQVNRALMYANDGSDSETFFVDGDNSSTRLSFQAEGELSDGVRVGGKFEVEYQSNPSNQVDFETKSIDAEIGERIMEAWVKSDHWGKVSLGQGAGAADGNMERDLSGTNIINWANPSLLGGAVRFGGTGPKISSTMSNLDFEGRYDRIRYDSPKFGPIVLSVSQGTKSTSDVSEAGARLEKKLSNGVRLRGALGYSVEDTIAAAGNEKTIGGSFAVRLASGWNAGIAMGKSSDDNDSNPDSSFKSIKLGYMTGDHAVSLMYALADDRSRDGDASKMLGIGYVYSPKKWMDVYAGYKVHSLDRAGANYDDIKIATSGIRLKF